MQVPDGQGSNSNPLVSLSNYIENIALLSAIDENNAPEDSNKISLMTVHSAKGLEFPYVYVVGMEENLFPSGSMSGIKETDLEEERRLFYVAMTRAKKELYITIPKRRYGKAVRPSRFVEEFRKSIDYGSQVKAGQRVYHKIYYEGVVKEVLNNRGGTRIRVDFGGSVKELDLKTCLKNEIIRFM